MKLKGGSHPKWDKRWGNSSQEQVSSYMDVKKILSVPVQKLQFMDLRYEERISVEAWISC